MAACSLVETLQVCRLRKKHAYEARQCLKLAPAGPQGKCVPEQQAQMRPGAGGADLINPTGKAKQIELAAVAGKGILTALYEYRTTMNDGGCGRKRASSGKLAGVQVGRGG